MPLTPHWPDASGLRVLMLVANDMTIDARVRKTATSVAAAGHSVISLGITTETDPIEDEVLEGAFLARVVPPQDPNVSPRRIRWSRPELLDSAKYRAETRRQLLHVARRHLSSAVAWNAENPPPWTRAVGEATAGILRRTGLSDEMSGKVGRRATRYARRAFKSIRFAPAKLSALRHQVIHQLTRNVTRLLARPSNRTLLVGSWERELPELHRFEAALGATIDELEPDLIHVHDVFLLGVGARAASRAKSKGLRTRLIYDAHEYVPGLPVDARRRNALHDLEKQFYGRADGVLTVSPGLADLLESAYGVRPTVVMNAPDSGRREEVDSIRNVIGAGEDAPLVVYVGGVAPHRGAEVLVRAVAQLESNVHLVFVSNSTTGYILDLLSVADELGLRGRVHIAPYVSPEAVVSYIRSATVSAVPLSRDFANYEIALPNKLFQSIHAGVPVVVSDNPEMKEFVTSHGVGEVFTGGDSDSLAKAILRVLHSPERYAEALRDPDLLAEISWDSQVERLLAAYHLAGASTR